MNALVNSYFEGLKSAQSLTVGSRGKNLFDNNKTVDSLIELASPTYLYRAIDNGRDVLALIGNVAYSNKILKIPFKPNTQYTMKYDIRNNGTHGGVIGFVYSDGTTSYPSVPTTSFVSKTIVSTIGKSIVGLILAPQSNGLNYIAIDNFQINEGTTALPYTPYVGSKAKIQCTDETKFTLAKLPNGLKNELIFG